MRNSTPGGLPRLLTACLYQIRLSQPTRSVLNINRNSLFRAQSPTFFTQVVSPNLIHVVVGAHNFHSTDMGRTVTYAADKIVVHRDRQGRPSMVDKALIRVKNSFDLQLHTPICLPEPDFDVRSRRNVVLAGEWKLLRH